MKFSGLSFAVILLFSSVILAQHSSGGGGSSGASSSSGGGSSHSSSGSGFSGGSSSHSSGSSISHASSSHGTSGHGSNGAVSSRIKTPQPELKGIQLHGTSMRMPQVRTATPEKRSFFSFLRHPFHRPQPKAVADLRRPVCFRGPCAACPAGQVSSGGGCGAIPRFHRNRDACTSSDLWSGGACVQQIHFLGDCNALRTAMQQEEQRIQAARLAQQIACTQGSIQECSDSMNASRGEESLYRSLQIRYRRCQQQQLVTTYPFGNSFLSADHAEPLFDHLNFGAEY